MTNSSNTKAVVRPLPVTAAVVAVLSGLAGIGLSFLGLLVGWGIGGTPGTVGDVLRSAVNLWLLSHRAGLRLDSELYTLAPLGLTWCGSGLHFARPGGLRDGHALNL